MIKKDSMDEQADAEKIDYIEFLRSENCKHSASVESNKAFLGQESKNVAKERDFNKSHVSHSQQKQQTKENLVEKVPTTVCKENGINEETVTIYEACAMPHHPLATGNSESSTSLPTTLSSATSKLSIKFRPPKWWHKKEFYSLDIASEQGLGKTDVTVNRSDLLQMPAIGRPVASGTSSTRTCSTDDVPPENHPHVV